MKAAIRKRKFTMFLIETTFNLIQTVTVTLQQFFKPVYF